MKIALMLLLLLPILRDTVLGTKTSTAEEYEFSVQSHTGATSQFNLIITGEEISANGAKTPFQLDKKNTKTPYLLALKKGQYIIMLESKAKEGGVISIIKSFEKGNILGSVSSDFRKAKFTIESSGDCSVSKF